MTSSIPPGDWDRLEGDFEESRRQNREAIAKLERAHAAHRAASDKRFDAIELKIDRLTEHLLQDRAVSRQQQQSLANVQLETREASVEVKSLQKMAQKSGGKTGAAVVAAIEAVKIAVEYLIQ